MDYNDFSGLFSEMTLGQKRAANVQTRKLLTQILRAEASKGPDSIISLGAMVRATKVFRAKLEITAHFRDGDEKLMG